MVFDPASSSADQACAVEYIFGAAESSCTDLPRLRMAVQLSERDYQVQLASSTGLWARPILRLWLRYFDRLLAAVATAPDIPWKTLPLLEPMAVQDFYRTFNATAEAYPCNRDSGDSRPIIVH